MGNKPSRTFHHGLVENLSSSSLLKPKRHIRRSYGVFAPTNSMRDRRLPAESFGVQLSCWRAARLLAAAVAFLFSVLLHYCASSHFLGALAVTPRSLGGTFDVLILALLLGARAAEMSFHSHNFLPFFTSVLQEPDNSREQSVLSVAHFCAKTLRATGELFFGKAATRETPR